MTNTDLINLANRDLQSKVDVTKQMLWDNAINGAKIALENSSNVKQAVVKILESQEEDLIEGSLKTNDINAFVFSVLFAELNDRISEENIKQNRATLLSKNRFKNIVIMTIQKASSKKVYDFLESECKL